MIRRRIVRQLLEVIQCPKYFPKESGPLSTVYWPRCLRDFIADIARQLAPTVKKESYAFGTEECIRHMSEPQTEYFVQDGYRNNVREFLLFALQHCSTLLGPKPREEELVPSLSWPADIIRPEDLREAIGSLALRSDVVSFLFTVQKALKFQLAFSYDYDAKMPITLEVSGNEAQAKIVEGFLETFGTKGHGNLAPLEVIEVVSRPELLRTFNVK